MTKPEPTPPPVSQPHPVESQSKAVATREANLGDIIMSPAFKMQIAAALPRHMTPERMARIALTELRKTPALLKCSQYSFLKCVIQCAQLGLEPGDSLGHAYLIPFGDECTVIWGWKGLVELARRSGQVSSVVPRIVKENDGFDYAFGLNERLDHVPAETGKRGRTTHVYVVARMKDPAEPAIFDVLDVPEVEKVRNMSKSKNSPAWANHWDEMAKKTAVRRICKNLPQSPELKAALDMDDGKQPENMIDASILVDALEIPAPKAAAQ